MKDDWNSLTDWEEGEGRQTPAAPDTIPAEKRSRFWTPAAPAPSALSNGHKEAEMEHTFKVGQRVKLNVNLMINTWQDSIGTSGELLELTEYSGWTEAYVDFGAAHKYGKRRFNAECLDTAEPTPDSGRVPSRFATPAATWDAEEEQAARDEIVFEFEAGHTHRAIQLYREAYPEYRHEDDTYIEKILERLIERVRDESSVNEIANLTAERDAAVADAEALREKYNETAQRAIVLREALELVLDRRNGHIVGTKHLHEADILQLEQALRAADAGAQTGDAS